MEHCRERDAVSNLLNISRLGNQLMQAEKPWKLVKSGVQQDKVVNSYFWVNEEHHLPIKMWLFMTW